MQLQENISLKKYNSFSIEAAAKYFGAFDTVEQLEELFSMVASREQKLVLGGGSNILLTKNFDGLVLKNNIAGIERIHEDDNEVLVRAGAGENWHQLVMYCIEQGLAGMENLSLIPGNVGACPMQNIGAYGVELKDVFHSLTAYHIRDKTLHVFSNAACEFGYRDSIFKNKMKGEFVICNVTFRLSKTPVFHTEYGAIMQELATMGIQELSIKAISRAIVNIRSSKLPDPKVIGNAGSFFKNPTIDTALFSELKNKFPGMAGYALADDKIKLAAGWLIEQCGWKGYREGDAGCHAKQALVLVNYGEASGSEILKLSDKIIRSVHDKFGISLEREVNII